MCDFSLHAIKNRLANEGEQLFIHKFHTGSKGLASKADLDAVMAIAPAPSGTGLFKRLAHHAREIFRVADEDAAKRDLPAVCVPPGARLQVDGIPAPLQRLFRVGEREEVTFVQLTAEPFRYRDAFRFDNGDEVLLQNFDEGVSIEVLSLEVKEEAQAVDSDCDHVFRVDGEECPNCGERENDLVAVPTNPGEWRMISNV